MTRYPCYLLLRLHKLGKGKSSSVLATQMPSIRPAVASRSAAAILGAASAGAFKALSKPAVLSRALVANTRRVLPKRGEYDSSILGIESTLIRLVASTLRTSPFARHASAAPPYALTNPARAEFGAAIEPKSLLRPPPRRAVKRRRSQRGLEVPRYHPARHRHLFASCHRLIATQSNCAALSRRCWISRRPMRLPPILREACLANPALFYHLLVVRHRAQR